MIQTKKSQVKRKEWEKQNQCDIRQPDPPCMYILPNDPKKYLVGNVAFFQAGTGAFKKSESENLELLKFFKKSKFHKTHTYMFNPNGE